MTIQGKPEHSDSYLLVYLKKLLEQRANYQHLKGPQCQVLPESEGSGCEDCVLVGSAVERQAEEDWHKLQDMAVSRTADTTASYLVD